MSIIEMAQLFNTLIIPVAILFAMLFALRWQLQRERERKEELKLKELEIIRARDYRDLEIEKQELVKRRNELEQVVSSKNFVGPESGGYLVINLPEEQKALFHDVLKGFEEYAQLKGYSIKFSIDNSLANKIAFKFTILPTKIIVSTEQVENDLHEYIEKVQRGDPLDDLPIVIPESHHHALLIAMRNRINFLHHTYVSQKNVIALYETAIRDNISRSMGAIPVNTFYLQGGGTIMPNNYTAIDSQNIAQGANNELSNNIIDQSIKIGSSFNEKRTQLELIDRLTSSLKLTTHASTEAGKKAIINLEKVKDELEGEENPDGTRVKKWLGTSKDVIATMGLTKEVVDIAKEVFASFGLSLS